LNASFHVVIPARFAASRLPGKPLLDVAGRPLVQWVWERARASGASSVVIATDDDRIASAARGFGAEVAMTDAHHASGTDRIAEVVRARRLGAEEIVVNVQGDEPMMPAAVIADVARALSANPDCGMATAAAPIADLEEFLDPNAVKALRAEDGSALYFSRAPVPWPREQAPGGRPTAAAGAWRHIGMYAYRVRSLLQFAAWPPTALESIEKLEQLRALEHGMRIHILALTTAPPAGVDTPADLERLRAILGGARIPGGA
jgi:3-deoxy-manno-octulosonate cytidylyltransferase (CMP-KDO synthetase)